MLRASTPNSARKQNVGWSRLVLLCVAILPATAPVGCKRNKAPVPTPPVPAPQAPTQSPPAPTGKSEPNAPPSPLRKVEQEVTELLSSGKQTEAEERLTEELRQYPGLEQIVSIMGKNRDDEVKKILREQPGGFRDQQRLLFLHAACVRSRFDVTKAWRTFLTVFVIDQATPCAQCAAQIALLDSNAKEHPPGTVDRAFAELTRLADANPNDVVMRWMLAVQCRNWNKNELGAKQFAKILEKWKPGPVLVHQSYANILDELKQFEKALEERRLAVEMEPAGWSYDGLGNTLHNLKRYDEAREVHAKAIELDPRRASYWANWASTLLAAKEYEEAIAKCQKSLALDKNTWRAWLTWGECLQAQGNNDGALEKYQKVLAIYPKHPDIRLKIAALMR